MDIQTLLVNTRDEKERVSFTQALLSPSATFGGLYTFESLPQIDLVSINSFQSLDYERLCSTIFNILGLDLESHQLLAGLDTYKTFDNPQNPAPIRAFDENTFCLELFHGPTRAFKDMALQPFGAILSTLGAINKTTYLILTATSGDTGPASLESFANKPFINVVCLYPHNGTSQVQRLQMVTQAAKNLKVIGIMGDFDLAQNTLKSLLASEQFNQSVRKRGFAISAANSINIGRIVFQIIYHFWAYLSLLKHSKITLGERISVVVPSGNFGNILGAFFAKQMGLPLDRLIVASNPNSILSDFINTGVYDIASRKLIQSKSPAMDILKSSNVERVLFTLFGAYRTRELMGLLESNKAYMLSKDETLLLQTYFSAVSCSDEMTLKAIKNAFEKGFVLDPHSAIGFEAARIFQQRGDIGKCLIVATAEWSKFATTVLESLTNKRACDDRQAIAEICECAMKRDIKLQVPKQILDLFDKQDIHNEILDSHTVENAVLSWLDSFKVEL